MYTIPELEIIIRNCKTLNQLKQVSDILFQYKRSFTLLCLEIIRLKISERRLFITIGLNI
ncbi:hypothetical protein SAMN04489761_0862 [Tenacibaculum sp. MAR_2009_124]|nr:hypothetical protein SAMN04489761_0862 [Tenacibaculum sp. MAR_2009_124]